MKNLEKIRENTEALVNIYTKTYKSLTSLGVGKEAAEIALQIMRDSTYFSDNPSEAIPESAQKADEIDVVNGGTY